MDMFIIASNCALVTSVVCGSAGSRNVLFLQLVWDFVIVEHELRIGETANVS